MINFINSLIVSGICFLNIVSQLTSPPRTGSVELSQYISRIPPDAVRPWFMDRWGPISIVLVTAASAPSIVSTQLSIDARRLLQALKVMMTVLCGECDGTHWHPYLTPHVLRWRNAQMFSVHVESRKFPVFNGLRSAIESWSHSKY